MMVMDGVVNRTSRHPDGAMIWTPRHLDGTGIRMRR
jgi:hypothetical protein